MAEAAVAAQQEVKKRAAVVSVDRFLVAEAANQRWVVNAEAGHTTDDITNPSYFSHVASRLTPLDDIRVRSENGDWVADLIVTACGENWARVKLLVVHDLSGDRSTPTQAIEHYVDWKGPQLKYCVIRKQDGQKLATGYTSKSLAIEWMAEHERTLRRAA